MSRSLFIGSSNVRRYWGSVPSALTRTSLQVTCTTLTTLSAALAKVDATTTFCVIEVLPNFICDCAAHLSEDKARLIAISGMLSEFVDIISPYAESFPKVNEDQGTLSQFITIHSYTFVFSTPYFDRLLVM